MTQKRLLLTLIASALVTCCNFGQTLFQRSCESAFFEQAAAVEIPGNGDYVLAGSTAASLSGQKNIWLARISQAGDIIWSKNYPLAQASEATAIQKTVDGNLLIAYTTGSAAGSTTSGWMKIAADGTLLWAKKAVGNSVLNNISRSSTGYLLCGKNITANGGETTGLLVHIGEDGNILWSSVFGEDGESGVNDCWEDADGIIYCCGYTSEINGKRNGFWAKVGPNGDLLSPVRRFGSDEADELTRIVPMGPDRLLMSGYTQGFGKNSYASVWTVVTDFYGNLKNSKTFSMPEQSLTTRDLITLPGNEYLLAIANLSGQLSPAIFMKLSAGLDQLFASQYRGGSESDIFTQVVEINGGFAASGTTYQNGDANAYLVVTDKNGRFDNPDCCPVSIQITRQDVTVQQATFVPTQTGFYAVQNVIATATNSTKTMRNLCREFALNFSVSADMICPGECVTVVRGDSTAGITYSFEYQGGTTDPDEPGQVCHTEGPVLFITLKGNSGSCEKSLTKLVALGGKEDKFPNAFTPNGDGYNDVFRPIFGCAVLSMHLEIYNRWGNKVFDTKDPAAGWDGKTDGANAASDVYVWRVEYTVEIAGSRETMTERGEVTLIR